MPRPLKERILKAKVGDIVFVHSKNVCGEVVRYKWGRQHPTNLMMYKYQVSWFNKKTKRWNLDFFCDDDVSVIPTERLQLEDIEAIK